MRLSCHETRRQSVQKLAFVYNLDYIGHKSGYKGQAATAEMTHIVLELFLLLVIELVVVAASMLEACSRLELRSLLTLITLTNPAIAFHVAQKHTYGLTRNITCTCDFYIYIHSLFGLTTLYNRLECVSQLVH